MSVHRLVALVICLVAAPVHGAQLSEPIANFEGMPIKTLGAAPSPAQVREAIIQAGQGPREWTFVDAGPGRLIATLSVRDKHTAEVNIAYTPESYSVTYRRSRNLRYNADGPTIHPSYNKWVEELVNNINHQISGVQGAGATPAASLRPVAAPAAAAVAAAPRQKPAGSASPANAAEVSFWESVRNSKDPSEFQAYLDAYPDGVFAPLARARLAALRK